MRTLAARVKSLLPRIQGSVRAFEEKHGISNGTLGALATGKRSRPSPEILQAVAAAFGVSVAWLVGEEVAPSEAAPAPERTTELDDRYPTRREAIALLRGVVDEQVLEAVALQSLEAKSDPGLEHWTKEIRKLSKLRSDIAREIEVEVPPPKKR